MVHSCREACEWCGLFLAQSRGLIQEQETWRPQDVADRQLLLGARVMSGGGTAPSSTRSGSQAYGSAIA